MQRGCSADAEGRSGRLTAAARIHGAASPVHGDIALVYAKKYICSDRGGARSRRQVSLDCEARNGEYAVNIRTLGLLHMKHATDRGTKRYAQECITGEAITRVRSIAPVRESAPARVLP
jgi:hypothetical protein